MKRQFKDKTILVVDDDPGILEVIKIILEDRGYFVRTLAEGSFVEKEVEKELPGLILIDLWMSGGDGHEVIQKLRKKETTKKIPIIALSALNNGEEIAKKAGADDFLGKPFNIEDLFFLVKKHL